MRFISLICLFFLNIHFLHAQMLSEMQLAEAKVYKTEKEIMGAYSSVYKLDLSKQRLSQLPSFVGKLRRLQFLNLGNNRFNDIPESIARLDNLQYLLLQNNRIAEVPKYLEKLRKLKVLVLLGNDMDGKAIEDAQKLLPKVLILVNDIDERSGGNSGSKGGDNSED